MILPIRFGKRVGEILVYVVEGSTPFLFARPVIEQMELMVDLGEKLLRWKNGPWFPVVSSPIGHYLLDMLEDIDLLIKGGNPQYALLPVDYDSHVQQAGQVPLQQALTEIIMLPMDDNEELTEDALYVKVLQPKQVRLCLHAVVQR